MKLYKIVIPAVAFMLLWAGVACAEYHEGKIFHGIATQKEIFQVEGWRQSDNKETWIATTRAEHMVLTVGKKNTGVISVVQDHEQAAAALIRCLALGEIVMAPQGAAQRDRIFDVISDAATSQKKKSTTMNGITLEVSPTEVGGNVVFSCILSPAKQQR